MFSLFLSIFAFLINSSLSLNVEKLNSMYVTEHIGFLTPIKNKYFAQIVIDGSSYSRDTINKIHSEVIRQCANFSLNYENEDISESKCHLFKEMWLKKIEKFNNIYDATFIEQFQDIDLIIKQRQRRGFWKTHIGSKIGDNIHNPLFGLMSYEDWKFQEEVNNKLMNGIEITQKLLNDNINETLSIANNMNENAKILNQLSRNFSSNIEKQQKYFNLCAFIDYSNDLYDLYISRLIEFNDLISDLLKKNINLNLIKNSNLMNIMKNYTMNENEKFFINPFENEFRKFLIIKDFIVKRNQKIIHITIPIPIIEDTKYEVIKVHPIVQIKDNIALVKELPHDLIIIENITSNYAKISENELLRINGKCFKYDEIYFCNGVTTFETKNQSCIKNIILNEKLSSCKTKSAKVKDIIITPLKVNTYIISVSNPTNATLQYSNKTVVDLIFDKSSLVTNDIDSTLLIKTLKINFFSSTVKNIKTNVITFKPYEINVDTIFNGISNISSIIKMTEFHTATIMSTQNIEQTFTEIQKAKEDQSEFRKNYNRRKLSYDWTIIIIIVTVIIIISLLIALACYLKI